MGTPRSHSTAARPISTSVHLLGVTTQDAVAGSLWMNYIRLAQVLTWRSASSLATP
jgi:hypothetical protein